MRTRVVRSTLIALALICGVWQTAAAQALTCIVIDEPNDMLGRDERTAARLLVTRQFELAGHRIVDRECAETYKLSHIRLGTTITVTLSGPAGSREATALGLDDLPAVYSQMVRAITTGQPMGLAVVDRSNVSATQDLPPRRVFAEGAWYAKVGFGTVLDQPSGGGGAFGFGYRAELGRLALDLSFLNFQVNDGNGYYGPASSASSLIKLAGLFFTNPDGKQSPYFGGGLSYGRATVRVAPDDRLFARSGSGSGLQADLTAGYEIARATSMRVFVQTDVTLPFYHVEVVNYSYPEPPSNGRFIAPTVTIERKYAPSVALSVGFGWQRRH